MIGKTGDLPVGRRALLQALGGLPLAAAVPAQAAAKVAGTSGENGFSSEWHLLPDQVWTGADLWAQPLQDWAVKDGAIRCVKARPDRTVHILTHQLAHAGQPFTAELVLRASATAGGRAGLRIGIRGRFPDYRSAIMTGTGLDCVIAGDGRLILGEARSAAAVPAAIRARGIVLSLSAEPTGARTRIALQAKDRNGRLLAAVSTEVARAELLGNVALLSHHEEGVAGEGAAFEGLRLQGPAFSYAPGQSFGPIYFAQYTVHRNSLRLSAQLAPIDHPGMTARLMLRRSGSWQEAARVAPHPLARVVLFQLDDWAASEDTPYRVELEMPLRSGSRVCAYEGTIAAEPRDKPVVRALTMSCNWDMGFPDADVVRHAARHDADLVMFLGDQFYESNGGFGVETAPLATATLDYLRKWVQFGWSYRELFRHRPSICLVDDHDVYHGNLWGSGGRAAIAEGGAAVRQDSGGYKMPAEWVNMAQLTQTAHMPLPADPRPVQQGISVYFSEWSYAGLDFAVIEDRKFKSAPRDILPEEAAVYNGYVQQPGFDDAKAKWHMAELLGERQMAFLRRWVGRTDPAQPFKVLVSATSFACPQTLPVGTKSDDITPKLPIPPAGTYVSGDAPTRDMDSNGWPQNRRNEVVRLLGQRVALHLTGDQHLGTVIRYGADKHGDGCHAFATPALCSIWPRRWWPPREGRHVPAGAPAYTGDFLDGFGNRFTLLAAANPRQTGLEPPLLFDRAPGYGVVDFDKRRRRITIACWPRHVDPAQQPTGQFEGWPISFSVDSA